MCKYGASKPPNVVCVSNDALRSPMMYVKTCNEVIHCFSNVYRSVSRPFCFGGVSSRIFLFTDHISTILFVNFPMISNQFPQKSCFPRHKLCFTVEVCEFNVSPPPAKPCSVLPAYVLLSVDTIKFTI